MIKLPHRFVLGLYKDFGLSALHYATWNGHVRCVEVLCINDIGRDENGLQRSCIDLQSCKGFTSLHLAASDGVHGGISFVAALPLDEHCCSLDAWRLVSVTHIVCGGSSHLFRFSIVCAFPCMLRWRKPRDVVYVPPSSCSAYSSVVIARRTLNCSVMKPNIAHALLCLLSSD